MLSRLDIPTLMFQVALAFGLLTGICGVVNPVKIRIVNLCPVTVRPRYHTVTMGIKSFTLGPGVYTNVSISDAGAVILWAESGAAAQCSVR